jgi:hypothetical protein
MLEQERPSRPTAAASAPQPMQKLFMNLGEKDGIRAQEIVAAVSSEAGIPGSQVGRVEVRDTHSIVEVAASVVELVLQKINGASVRGRRVQARLDTPRGDRPERSGPPARGGDRPARSFGDRPARTFGDRPARPARPGDRPTRPGAPRGAAPRGDRPDRSDRGDRPARPAGGPPRRFDRDAGPPRPPRSSRPHRDDA